MADIESILKDAEFLLQVEKNKELYAMGQVKLEDVQQMAPDTPIKDFIAEMANPFVWLSGAGSGAITAKMTGKPILKTMWEYTDPTLGFGKVLKDILVGRPGAMGKAADLARDQMQKAKYSQKFGAKAKKPPNIEIFPRYRIPEKAQAYAEKQFQMGAPERLSSEATSVFNPKLLTEGTPRRGPFNLPRTTPIETTYGPFGGIQPPAEVQRTIKGLLTKRTPFIMKEGTLFPEIVEQPVRGFLEGGTISGEIADLTNTFARKAEPIEELTGSLIQMLNRNKLLKEAEKLLGGFK